MIQRLLEEQGVVEKKTLQQGVKAALAQGGKSRRVFKSRFEAALADPQFVDSPSGYRLAEEGGAESPADAPPLERLAPSS